MVTQQVKWWDVKGATLLAIYSANCQKIKAILRGHIIPDAPTTSRIITTIWIPPFTIPNEFSKVNVEL